MRKVAFGLGVAMMASAGIFSVSAFQGEPRIRPNTLVAGVNLGGLTSEEAAFRLRSWWETERQKKLILKSPHLLKGLPGMTPGQLGLTLDDAATVAQLPKQDAMQDILSGDEPEAAYEPVFKSNGMNLVPFGKSVAAVLPQPKPAQVLFTNGSFVHKPEVAGMAINLDGVYEAVKLAVQQKQSTVDLPIVSAPKKVSDEQLATITEVVSTFSTSFPRNPNRNTNIRLAAAKLDGHVLAPGETMSFNDTVGRRTLANGFKEAGVYSNGRHDTGVGGGICQVSTTLYNAALFGNIAVPKRQNHSMPVAYVPVGRDATVNYGAQDLVIENNQETPIAIDSEYRPGRLTFRILGRKIPGQQVKIERANLKTWSRGTDTIVDPSLPAGSRKVVEKGSAGHSVNTFRVVLLNGEVVKREPLGRSYYTGGKRIIAVGPAKKVPATEEQVTNPETDGQG